MSPKVEIVITPAGVELVRLYGGSPIADDVAMAIYVRLRPLLQLVPEALNLRVEDESAARAH